MRKLWICIATALALTATLAAVAISPGAAGDAALAVAPGATGDCSPGAPCGSIDAAFSRASAGQIIEMAGGDYGQQDIQDRALAASFSENVEVRPAPGAVVNITGMQVFAQHLTVRGLNASGSLFIRPGAHYSSFEDMTTAGGTMLVTAADHVVLRNNRIVPGVDSDGMQIKGLNGVNPRHLLIEGNIIGPARRGPGRGHVDCIQFLGGEHVTVRANVAFHCGTQALIAGAGATGTLPGPMLVENNFLQLCRERTSSCDGYNTVNVNVPDLTFRNNTVVDGGTVFNDTRGLDVRANYIESLKTCSPEIAGNLYASSGCSPDASNGQGTPDFVSPTTEPPDLRLAPGSIGIDFGVDAGTVGDIDGNPRDDQPDAGAHEYGAGGGAPSTPTSEPPTSAPPTSEPPTSEPTTPTTAAPEPRSMIADLLRRILGGSSSSPAAPASTPPPPPPTTSTSTTAFEPAEVARVSQTFEANLHSKRTFKDFTVDAGTGTLSVAAVARLGGGVSSGNLVISLFDAGGNELARATGNTDAALDRDVVAGQYRIRVSARPSYVTLTVEHAAP